MFGYVKKSDILAMLEFERDVYREVVEQSAELAKSDPSMIYILQKNQTLYLEYMKLYKRIKDM